MYGVTLQYKPHMLTFSSHVKKYFIDPPGEIIEGIKSNTADPWIRRQQLYPLSCHATQCLSCSQ